jgi:glycosyltransferase involved in cell wall biosynthesis
MRIGMILDKTFPPDPRVENEALALIKNGHSVFLFCLTYSNANKNETINGIEIRRYKSNKFLYKLSALVYTIPLYTLILKRKINHFLRKNNIEAIHIHDIQIAEAVFKANKNLRLKTILDLHENRPEIMRFYPHIKSGLGKYLINPAKWKLKEEKFCMEADNIIVVTNEAKNELISRIAKLNHKITVLPNTVPFDYSKSAKINQHIVFKYLNKFSIVYVGDTALRRGLDTVLESLNYLDKIDNLKLILIGSSSEDVFLNDIIVKNDLGKKVDFVGWINPEEIPSYIAASKICISPLHRNLHHDTTYANKLFQYMSFAKPVLVSNATAQKNLIERTQAGLVHIEKDAHDFAKKVLQLYENEKLRNQMGKNGKLFIENEFNWDITSQNLINLYNNLN